jgi:hypothetical protein
MIAVNTVWQVSKTWTAKPLVQGFVGAILALILAWGAANAYGAARWHLYGRNNDRINTIEQRTNQMWNYLVQQEAAKAAGGK